MKKPPTRDELIIGLYKAEHSSQEIAARYGVTTRQVQRIVKNAGLSRTISESFNLAIKHGRMKYYKKPEHLKAQKRKSIGEKLRYQVMQRDNYVCQRCGNTVEQGVRLEIDHIDNDNRNNDISNLQVLCNLCNHGKALNDNGNWSPAARVV